MGDFEVLAVLIGVVGELVVGKAFLDVMWCHCKGRRTSGVTRDIHVAELCIVGVHPSLQSELHGALVLSVHPLSWGRTLHGFMGIDWHKKDGWALGSEEWRRSWY